MQLLKMQRNDYFIAKKYERQKYTSQINLNAPLISTLFYTSVS
jgi:hypothetical protein